MKPTLVLQARELARHAQRIATGTGCCVVPRPASNPTLVAHGLARAARWHILTHDPPRRAIADLYVGSRAEAHRVTRLLANLVGAALDLLDNSATPADLKSHPRSIAEPSLVLNPGHSVGHLLFPSHLGAERKRTLAMLKRTPRPPAASTRKRVGYLTASTTRSRARARATTPGYALARGYLAEWQRSPRADQQRMVVEARRIGRTAHAVDRDAAHLFLSMVGDARRNPARSKAARSGRKSVRKAFRSRRVLRATLARARAIKAGGSGASELARFGYRLKSHEDRTARRRANPSGRDAALRRARRLWGITGHVHDDGRGHHAVGVLRGWGSHFVWLGEGASWDAAFKAARGKRAPAADRGPRPDDYEPPEPTPKAARARGRKGTPRRGERRAASVNAARRKPALSHSIRRTGTSSRKASATGRAGSRRVNPHVYTERERTTIDNVLEHIKPEFQIAMLAERGIYVSARELGRLRAERRRTRRTANPKRPASPLARATEAFRKWQDRGPITVRTRRVKAPKPLTGAAAELGRLVAVTYRSDKYDGKVKDHEHVFSEPLAALVTDPDMRDLHIVRGGSRYAVTPDGITN